jgi:hypothetical protein
MRRSRLQRRVEQAALGELSPKQRAEVVEHLRADEGGRATYDRLIDAFRVLERRPIARFELELVEDWLFEEVAPAEQEEQARVFGWTYVVSIFAAIAAAVVLVVGPLGPDAQDSLRPKGGRTAALSIDALCGTPSTPLASASEGCDLDGTLSFAYRVAPEHMGVLSLFGVDSEGNVNYYAPTPVDPDPIEVLPGGWRPVSMSIELPVNHQVGSVRLFALLSPRAPTVDEIDAMAAMLHRLPPATPRDLPWHRRLAGQAPLTRLCGPTTCESAEMHFTIYEDPS